MNTALGLLSDFEQAEFVNFRNLCSERVGSKYSTHALHSYPAQLIPQIPYYFFRELTKPSCESIVLDPFCGAGTVLVEAMHNGWNSIGVEINPVASLIAKAKTTPISEQKIKKWFTYLSECYKKINYDDVELVDFENVNYWFNKRVITELSKIKYCLELIEDIEVCTFFKVIFSSIIKKVSKTDPKMYVPVLKIDKPIVNYRFVWQYFTEKLKEGIFKINQFNQMLNKETNWSHIYIDDIKKCELLYDDIDMILTSPPYISAQKYVRSTRLESYWLGFNKQHQLDINKNTIGTERIPYSFYNVINYTEYDEINQVIEKVFKKNKIRAGIMSKYFIDMDETINKLYNVLSKNGKFILVIGDNTVTNYNVPTHKYLSKISEKKGFTIDKIYIDKINSRGLMTKRNLTASIINYEWIIVMTKY